MNKYLRLLRFELKGLTRDPITLLLLAFPALLLALSCYALPLVLRTLPPMEALAAQAVTLLMIMMVASFGGIMAGAMATFTLLDHKDEHTLHTIAATPLGLPGYLLFKMTYQPASFRDKFRAVAFQVCSPSCVFASRPNNPVSAVMKTWLRMTRCCCARKRHFRRMFLHHSFQFQTRIASISWLKV